MNQMSCQVRQQNKSRRIQIKVKKKRRRFSSTHLKQYDKLIIEQETFRNSPLPISEFNKLLLKKTDCMYDKSYWRLFLEPESSLNLVKSLTLNMINEF